MSNKLIQNESPVTVIKNETTRQRWELFHRAIAHAKQSNVSAMQESESVAGEPKQSVPVLSIVT